MCIIVDADDKVVSNGTKREVSPNDREEETIIHNMLENTDGVDNARTKWY